MAGEKQVSLVIRARDRTRAAFRSAGRRLQRLGRRARLAGAALAAAFGVGAVNVAKTAREIQNLSDNVGVTAEELQAVQRVFARFGDINIEATADILRDISVRAQEAKDDSGEVRDAFERLLFTRAALSGSPVEILQGIQDGAREAGLTVQEFNQALDAIGGDQLVLLSRALRQGGRIRADIQTVADSDTIQSNEAVAATAQLTADVQEKAAEQTARLADTMGENIPAVIELTDAVRSLFRTMSANAEANRQAAGLSGNTPADDIRKLLTDIRDKVDPKL